MAQQVSPQAQAVARQLKAEISATTTRHNSIPKVAKALGLEYTTFYRRINGKLPLSQELIFATLDLIHVEPREFWTRAIERMESQQD